MEVPRLAVKSELQLPAYPTATAMQVTSATYTTAQATPDPQPTERAHAHGYELGSLTRVLMDTSQVHYH